MKAKGLASFFHGFYESQASLACDPIGLVEFVRDYGVREFGTVFLYVPTPARIEDRAAIAWLTILSAKNIVGSRPWYKKADQVDRLIKQSHPHLLDRTAGFEIYRLNNQKLSVFLDRLTM